MSVFLWGRFKTYDSEATDVYTFIEICEALNEIRRVSVLYTLHVLISRKGPTNIQKEQIEREEIQRVKEKGEKVWKRVKVWYRKRSNKKEIINGESGLVRESNPQKLGKVEIQLEEK